MDSGPSASAGFLSGITHWPGYGTSRMDAYSIFEDTVNLTTVTVRYRNEDGDGKYHYEVNKNETMLTREKQIMIKEKFKVWLFA